MTRLALGLSCVVALLGVGNSASVDSLVLVQKSLAIHGEGYNQTYEAAKSMMVKMSGLVHILDHALGHGKGKSMHKRQPNGALSQEPDGDLLKRLFECTRSSGITTMDKVVGITNDIVNIRLNCKTQDNAQQARGCTKSITGFLANTLGLIMILPSLPETCFLQTCDSSDPKNFLTKTNPMFGIASGAEVMLNLMTAIGNVDATCITKETAPLAAVNDANLKYPSWLYWAAKPFDLMSKAYDIEGVAIDKEARTAPYAVCGSIAGFTSSAFGLMEALFDAKADQEYKNLGDRGQSPQYACASGLAKLIGILPGTMDAACNYESCKFEEPVTGGGVLSGSFD